MILLYHPDLPGYWPLSVSVAINRYKFEVLSENLWACVALQPWQKSHLSDPLCISSGLHTNLVDYAAAQVAGGLLLRPSKCKHM